MFTISSGLYKITYVDLYCIAFSTAIVSFWIRSGEKFFAGWNLTAVVCGTQCRCTVIFFFYRQFTAHGCEIASDDEVQKISIYLQGVFRIAKASCSVFTVDSRTTETGCELSNKLFSLFVN